MTFIVSIYDFKAKCEKNLLNLKNTLGFQKKPQTVGLSWEAQINPIKAHSIKNTLK